MASSPAVSISVEQPRRVTEGLTRKASLNAVAAALDYSARAAVEFAINPLLVSGLGDDMFGLWRVLWRATSYMLITSGRSAQALKCALANSQVSGDFERKRRDVGAAVGVWVLMLPLLGAVGGALAWFVPSLVKVPADFVWTARLAAGILAAHVILLSLADVPRAVLQGENLGYKRMGLSTLVVLAGGAFTVLALWLETGLAGVAAATLATTILNGILFVGVARKNVEWFGLSMPSFEDVRRFMGLSWWFAVWKLVMQVLSASDVVILSMLGSLEAVTVYSLTKYVPEAMIGLVAIFVFGIAPGLGGLIGADKLKKAAGVRNEIAAFTWLLATVAGTTILLWNRSFLTLWVGDRYDAGATATLLITIMTTQFVLIRNDTNIIDLTLEVKEKTIVGLISAFLSVALAAALVGPLRMGIVGLCFGYIGGRALMSLAYPRMVGRILGLSLASQIKASLRPACVSAILFFLALRLGRAWAMNSWPGLIAVVGLTVVVTAPSAALTGLPSSRRAQLFKRARQVISSGKSG